MTSRFQWESKPEWRGWVTAKGLFNAPIHRWFTFPHSFTGELVNALIDEWGLQHKDRLLDPFVGAGTTLVAAQYKNVPANGYDLSPLSVDVSRAKIAKYDINQLNEAWSQIIPIIERRHWKISSTNYPDLVCEALPGNLLAAFDTIVTYITELSYPSVIRRFFQTAIYATLPRFSRAVASGGWLKWVEKDNSDTDIADALSTRVKLMLDDVQHDVKPKGNQWHVALCDVRTLPEKEPIYTAVITSPPYPNRHDYTRVFGIELLFGFINQSKIKQLRRQSFESHVESHPNRPALRNYVVPDKLTNAIKMIVDADCDSRVPRMLDGYFKDMHLCLTQIKRVCKRGAHIALVVGNVQYCGQTVPVDEITAELGEHIGLKCEKLVVARLRGNSAQQMGKWGRNPSRETIVVLRKK